MLPVMCIDFAGNDIQKGHPCIVAYPDDGCYNIKNVELLQFTGLKDKNGKEIYEGDIVKTERAVYKDISVIIWEYLEFKLKSVQELPQSSLHKFEYGNLSPILKYFDLEVIGNIYDNPELLQR